MEELPPENEAVYEDEQQCERKRTKDIPSLVVPSGLSFPDEFAKLGSKKVDSVQNELEKFASNYNNSKQQSKELEDTIRRLESIYFSSS